MGKQPGQGAPKTTQTPGGGGGAPVSSGPVNCTAEGCKSRESRFSFCGEHYEQFKFGLIKKDGKPAADYYKKLEHYQTFVARQQSARKAA